MPDLPTLLNLGSFAFALLGLAVAGFRYAKSKQIGDREKAPLVLGLLLASLLQIANMLIGQA